MTNNFVAAMKAMREEPSQDLRPHQGNEYIGSDGAHAHGGRVGFAEGGGVEDVFNYYMPNPNAPDMTVMDRTWTRAPGNWMPPTNPEWNTPTPDEMRPATTQLQPTQATQPEWETSTRLPSPQPEKSRGFLAGLKDYLPQRAGLIPENMRLPLLTAGLGMMKSNSPYLGQAIGEGGLMGVQTYMTQEQQARANELKKRQIELQSQRLADAAERARQTLDFNRDKHNDLNEYRDRSLAVRQNPAARKGAIENLADRLKDELGIPFSEALARVKSSNKDPQTSLALERLALAAAKADDIAYKNDPKTTLQKWRKDYGLPDKPDIIKPSNAPQPFNYMIRNPPATK
jgi:hypothetical protein